MKKGKMTKFQPQLKIGQKGSYCDIRNKVDLLDDYDYSKRMGQFGTDAVSLKELLSSSSNSNVAS